MKTRHLILIYREHIGYEEEIASYVVPFLFEGKETAKEVENKISTALSEFKVKNEEYYKNIGKSVISRPERYYYIGDIRLNLEGMLDVEEVMELDDFLNNYGSFYKVK